MASKYDTFWRERLPEIALLINEAAHSHGKTSTLDVSSIQRLGERESWYGKATLRGDQIVDAPMAHVVALANQVVAEGLCRCYPDVTFTFTVDSHGGLLVVATPGPERQDPPAIHEAAPPPATDLRGSSLTHDLCPLLGHHRRGSRSCAGELRVRPMNRSTHFADSSGRLPNN